MQENPWLSGRIPPKSGWLDSLEREDKERAEKNEKWTEKAQDDQVWLINETMPGKEQKKQMEIAGMEAIINTLWTEHSTLTEELRQMKVERSFNLQSPPRDPQDDGHTPYQDDGNPLQDDGQDDGHTPLPQGPPVLISKCIRSRI